MKTAESRIYNLVTDIPKLLTPHFGTSSAEAFQFAIYHWMNNNPGRIVPVGQSLTLTDVDNSSMFKKGDKHASYRELTRLFLLYEATYGTSVATVIQATKNRLLSKTNYGNATDAVTRLRTGVNRLSGMNFNGSYSSFFQEQDKTTKIKQGYSDAKALLTLINGKLANPNNTTRARVAYWFGTAPNVLNSVQQNFQRMTTCIGQRRFILKEAIGPGQTALKDIYAETGRGHADRYPNMSISIGFGSAYFDNNACTRKPKLATTRQAISDFNTTVESFTSRDNLSSSNIDKVKKAYYTRLIKKHSGTINRKSVISYAGTIIHELSHAKLGTEDLSISGHLNVPNNSITTLYGQKGQQVYGHYFSHLLAQTTPADALINADNYRLFSESFYDDF